ncbi:MULTISPECIES: Bax inhibitor-1/YccA family protein [unclassified Rhizobium]|jgi:FtsH-binding integral membrane protein|uniref:Bax inhibitor-1/YccA family protein n=1 Tax=unclassified Rhizobium TaxID=2613769 RepID=UPI000DD5FEB8|nr:Bax inhibitor-1/YccA family protein [Rhizobium sp. BG4]QRM43816.1 Bax inhibitor-1/YccA family protein [Rhizobium sp. BG4]
MADLRNYQSRAQTGEMIDQGLRSYMLKVYNLMALGLAITGVAAYLGFNFAVQDNQLTQFGVLLFQSPLRWVVILAPLAAVFFLSFRINRMSVAAAQTTFWVYAALVGLSLSSIFLVYTQSSITQTFFVTAASFGALSLYGYTTKRDLSAMGSFLIMGLFGLIIASIVNIFLGSSALQFAISVIGVLIFAGLTAYDTQRIKELYYEADGAEVMGRKAIMGALTLYLDFINLFMFLLQFMGNRK